MSEGACIIANNSGKMDYIGLASISARLIRKHLKIPVCLITSDLDEHEDFDQVIRTDSKPGSQRTITNGSDVISYEWKNDHRIDSFYLTPYDRTLLLDADYLVMSDALLPMLRCDQEFMIVDSVYDITGNDSFARYRYLPDGSLKQRWATVMAFDKSAKTVFEAADMVRKNYGYYAAMFHWNARQFRNDFVFTVAAHLLSVPDMPFEMNQLASNGVISTDARGLKFATPSSVIRWKADLHVIHKSIAMNPKILEPLLDA